MQPERTIADAGGSFDPIAFLSTAGPGRTVSNYRLNKTIIAQGSLGDAVFYILQGKVKLTFASEDGREATFAVLSAGDFFGHNCLSWPAPGFVDTRLSESRLPFELHGT